MLYLKIEGGMTFYMNMWLIFNPRRTTKAKCYITAVVAAFLSGVLASFHKENAGLGRQIHGRSLAANQLAVSPNQNTIY